MPAPYRQENIEVLYSDDSLIVVNKPENLLSVPGRGPDKKDCLVSRLQSRFPTLRVVHRLDCATSGLMVLALNIESQRELNRQFHDREVQKRYVACVLGHCAADEGEIREPLITDWPNRPRQKVDPEGKPALTRYRCMLRGEQHGLAFSRMALTPVTGRSHQLRVHMLHLGHAILGDRLYATEAGIQASNRLQLHAEQLSFHHPQTKQAMDFETHASF